ncbi:DUF4959 domain-containing protein [Candidatus Symbiothrix dinenymphae]|uniref:DUF4959 domain-containing protein n=1 Tax=Candidatus Symbiothrix dinenymphae TaxID=467085 RepID=UPI0006C09F65|nr:DUF4959 domain-containing protein [Candidatus Symbiothrix dinenymphae]GAP73133.1 hypothetical protein SAMD00024442_61_3 [Candidatus Symbiothrix dinenymphae]
MNNFRKIAILLLVVVAGFYSCEEGGRFGISSDDTTPPSPPVFDTVWALPGGARIFYEIPADEDVISIEASFTATNGKLIKSAVSFFAPYLEVFGLPDTTEQTLQLYALDRAGNQSTVLSVKVKPEEPAYRRVANSLNVYPAFGAILLTWENVWQKDGIVQQDSTQRDVNVYVDFSYPDNGQQRSIRQVISSNKDVERQFINGLNLSESEPVSVQVTVEDLYGNRTASIDTMIRLKTDKQLDKSKWVLPAPGVLIEGVAMSNGGVYDGKNELVIDGLVNDELHPSNYAYFANNLPINVPFNFMIDLRDKYELSRIVTHQRRFFDPTTLAANPRGDLYLTNNVGIYKMYYWNGDDDDPVNDASGQWVEISEIKIPVPEPSATILDIVRMGKLGDESLMYPDSATFTPATRWFRYEVIAPFDESYGGSLQSANSLSEITLYGRKAE